MKLMKQVIIILLVIALLPISHYPAFASENEYLEEGQRLSNLRILVGENNDLRLNDPLNRYEGLILAIRIAGKESIAKAFDITSFDAYVADEVPFWAKHYVQYALAGDLRITSGVDISSDGKTIFGGDETLSALQFSTFILKATGYDVPDWKLSLNQLVNLGVITNQELIMILDGEFTRGKAAFLLDRVLASMNIYDGVAVIENLINIDFVSRSVANENSYGKTLTIKSVGLNSFNIVSSKKLNIYSAEFKNNYIVEINGNSIGQNDFTLQLQDDQRTVYLDINNLVNQNDEVKITIKNMLNENNELIDGITFIDNITDNFGASIISSKTMGDNTVLITFNEKIKTTDLKAFINDKEVMSLIQTADRELFILLHDNLSDGEEFKVSLTRVLDSVGYKTNPKVTIKHSYKPLDMTIRNITTNGYDMVFNQRISDNFGNIVSDAFTTDFRSMFSHSFESNHPYEVTSLDGFRIKVLYNTLIPFGSANFYVNPTHENRYLIDASSKAVTETLNIRTFLQTDKTAPTVVSISKQDNTHITLVTSEPLMNATVLSNYSLVNNNSESINILQIDKVNPTTLVFTTDALDDKEIVLSINNLQDVYGNTSSVQLISLTGVLSKEAPTIDTTGYYSYDQKKVEIRFSKEMNTTILNPTNYLFDGKVVPNLVIQSYEKNSKVVLTLPEKLSLLTPSSKIVVKVLEDSYGNQTKYDLTTVLCIPSNIVKEDLMNASFNAITNTHLTIETPFHVSSINDKFIYFTNNALKNVSLSYNNNGTVIGLSFDNPLSNDLSNLTGELIIDQDAITNALGTTNSSLIKFNSSVFEDKISPRIITASKTSAKTIILEASEPLVPESATFDKFVLSGSEIADIAVVGNIVTISTVDDITSSSILVRSGLYDFNRNKLSSTAYYSFD